MYKILISTCVFSVLVLAYLAFTIERNNQLKYYQGVYTTEIDLNRLVAACESNLPRDRKCKAYINIVSN